MSDNKSLYNLLLSRTPKKNQVADYKTSTNNKYEEELDHLNTIKYLHNRLKKSNEKMKLIQHDLEVLDSILDKNIGIKDGLERRRKKYIKTEELENSLLPFNNELKNDANNYINSLDKIKVVDTDDDSFYKETKGLFDKIFER